MHEAFAERDVCRAVGILRRQDGQTCANAAYAAAQALLRIIRRVRGKVSGSSVLVLAGPGENGRISLSAGTFLARRGVRVKAVTGENTHPCAAPPPEGYISRFRLPDSDVLRKLAEEADVWVDGIFGSGILGEIREPYRTWLKTLRDVRSARAGHYPPPAVAVDLPSGISADGTVHSGYVLPASYTVALGCFRPAHLLPAVNAAEEKDFFGEVILADTGIMHTLRAIHAEPAVRRVGRGDVSGVLTVPTPSDNKYSRGVLGLCTGSKRYPGAGYLSAGAALKTGVGMLCYLGGSPQMPLKYPEAVMGGKNCDAYVIGCGITDREYLRRAYRKAVRAGVPAVLDAEAIPACAGLTGNVPTLLTAHQGELVKLYAACGQRITLSQIRRNPQRAAAEAARMTGAAVLLKGFVTVIAAPGGGLYAQADAPTWLAAAGTGDVLAGIAGSLLACAAARAKRETGMCSRAKAEADSLPAKIAACAVFLHSSAASRAARVKTHSPSSFGNPISAGDIIGELPETVYRILSSKEAAFSE